MQLIISDAHAGLKEARRAVFGGIPWQHCQFRLQQNAQAYVPRQGMKKAVAADIRAILDAPNGCHPRPLGPNGNNKYAENAPRLAE